LVKLVLGLMDHMVRGKFCDACWFNTGLFVWFELMWFVVRLTLLLYEEEKVVVRIRFVIVIEGMRDC
jgi:hypothetical protein